MTSLLHTLHPALEDGTDRGFRNVGKLQSLYIQPLKMEPTEGSETSANYNRTPGKYPKEYIQHIICSNTKIRSQEYSPMLTRGHYTRKSISERYRYTMTLSEITDRCNTGSVKIALYIIQNALRYVQTIKCNQIECVCYWKFRNFLFLRTTFVMLEFHAKRNSTFFFLMQFELW